MRTRQADKKLVLRHAPSSEKTTSLSAIPAALCPLTR